MIRFFLGYDPREAIGYHVCCQSIIEKASDNTDITAISGPRRDGTNDFIYSRFLVPHYCNYQGFAIWMDGADMIFREDPAELWALREKMEGAAVAVVKHSYKTKHPRKYVGSKMESPNEDYPRKNWSSIILWDCEHPLNRVLTKRYVEERDGRHLHTFGWLPDDFIAPLPTKWNVLIGEEGEEGPCALAHFTIGIPAFPHYARVKYAAEWWALKDRAMRAG